MGYNQKHKITPKSVQRAVQESLHITFGGAKVSEDILAESNEDIDVTQVIGELQVEMQEAASRLEFEKAALLRDQIEELKKQSKNLFPKK